MHTALTVLALSFILYLPQLFATLPSTRTAICMLSTCGDLPVVEPDAPAAVLWLPAVSR
jgi:hypothetical protein